MTDVTWRRARTGMWHAFQNSEVSACGRMTVARSTATWAELLIASRCYTCLAKLGLKRTTLVQDMDAAVTAGAILVLAEDNDCLLVVDPRDDAFRIQREKVGAPRPLAALYDSYAPDERLLVREWRRARQRWARGVELRDSIMSTA